MEFLFGVWFASCYKYEYKIRRFLIGFIDTLLSRSNIYSPNAQLSNIWSPDYPGRRVSSARSGRVNSSTGNAGGIEQRELPACPSFVPTAPPQHRRTSRTHNTAAAAARASFPRKLQEDSPGLLFVNGAFFQSEHAAEIWGTEQFSHRKKRLALSAGKGRSTLRLVSRTQGGPRAREREVQDAHNHLPRARPGKCAQATSAPRSGRRPRCKTEATGARSGSPDQHTAALPPRTADRRP